MGDLQRPSLVERDIDQAITALKKGAHLLKYGRRGKPKFCPFRLSADESTLIWYYGKDEKTLELRHVSRIIPGQRTAIFQRYPRPEKEYQSFSLIYSDRSLDVICKDKDEAEVWFVGLKALISRGSYRRSRNESKSEIVSSDSPRARKVAPSTSSFDQADNNTTQRPENVPQSRLGKAFADIVSYTAATKKLQLSESIAYAPPPTSENSNSRTSGVDRTSGADRTSGTDRTSGADTYRASLSSAMSSSSQGSCTEDFDSLGDVFIWGEGAGAGILGGSAAARTDRSSKNDAFVPKPLESTSVLDVQSIACGHKHAVLVTKQGEIFSWGEESGGRLGHGVEKDISNPKPIESLSGKNIEYIACGEYHTCAVTISGDLYTWGDGYHNCGLLGHGSGSSHSMPKRVGGPMSGLHVSSVSCGPWHTALLTSSGRLFTYGDGTFGALGHGDRSGSRVPREVEALKGLRAVRVACGVWHTAAIVQEEDSGSGSGPFLSGKLFTWGDGDKGRLGHGDNESRLVPESISSLSEMSFSRVACGENFTVALTNSGRVYAMGGRLSDGKSPTLVKGGICNSRVEEIACGSHHVAVLTSKAEIYTWGRGKNGQLGHGDDEDRQNPAMVEFFRDKQVKSIACGENFTAVICLHKWISSADNSLCSGCRSPFNFMRQRHNCYNCGLVFCKACSARKSLKASLAPSGSKPYRVCDDCFNKLQKDLPDPSGRRIPKVKSGGAISYKAGETNVKWRLSSVESFKSERSSTFTDPNDNNRVFPPNGNNGNSVCQRTSTSSKSPTSPFGKSSFVSFSVPGSRIVSRSPSPMRSATPSPPLSFRNSEANVDDFKGNNESLNQEVKTLKAQVEELISKSHLLENELEKKSRQLKEVTARAKDEAEKNKAAKEVIKALTSQLKELVQRPPEEQISSNNLDTNERISADHHHHHHHHHNNNRPSNGSSVASPRSTSSDNLTNSPLANGTKAQVQTAERIIQDEPGVYITLLALPDGVNELRRVRFSRKRFTEDQAERWWAENESRVCERHNIRAVQ